MTLIAALWLACGPVPDDRAELLEALGRAAKLEGYRFRAETEQERPLGGGEGAQPAEGAYRKDAGFHLRNERLGELFRKEGRTWIREPKGEWEDGGAAVRRLAGGLRGGAPEPGKPNPQFVASAGKLAFLNQKAFHEECRDLPAALDEVRREEDADVDGVKMKVFAADLKEEALKASPLARMVTRASGDRGTPAFSGTVRLWVNPDGDICCLESRLVVGVVVNGNAVEQKTTRRTEILERGGSVKLEPPAIPGR